MPSPHTYGSAAAAESKRQIFVDPTGWRGTITAAFIAILTISFSGAAAVIIISVLAAPRMSAPAGPQFEPVAGPVAGKSFDLRPREPPVAVAYDRSRIASASRVMRLAFFSGYDDGPDTRAADLLSLKQHARDLDAIVPLWLGLRSGSTGAKLLISREQNETIDWLRRNANNVSIFPELRADLDVNEFLALFADAESRSTLRDQIVKYLGNYGFGGIVFDATKLPASSCVHAVMFLRSLRSRLSEDKRKTFALVAPSAQRGCLLSISSAVDYVIAATQDENIERRTLGALSSQGWFEDRLRRLIATVQPSKLIVTIGAFASDINWAGNSTIMPVQGAWDVLHRERARLELDGNSLNPTFAYLGKDGGEHRVWLLDGVTAFNQAKVAMAVPLAGVAVWRLGFEDPGVWHSIGFGRSPDAASLRALERPEPGYGNYRFVEGALLSAGPDSIGQRTLVYDPNLGLVTSEEITQPPLRGEQGVWRSSDPEAVALTFDDGPDPRFTGKILEILREKGVRATFYLIGHQALGSPELVRRIYAEGHDIGSHTFSHPNPFKIDFGRLKIELNATQRVFESTLGIQTHLFRPPYANFHFGYLDAEPKIIQTVTQLGYVISGMDVESCDFCGVGVDLMVNEVMDGVLHQRGRIILLHDGGGDRLGTIAALPILIDRLRAAGFHFVTTHEMIGLSREQLMPPWRPLAFLAQMQTETWMKLTAAVRYLSERGPNVIIGTIVLGMARLSLIAVLAIIQFWRRDRRREEPETYPGSVEVLVPAYNEEKVICKTVRAILSSNMVGGLKVIVIDDGSTDKTSQVLREQFADEHRLILLRKENAGKAAALNYGLSRSNADVVVAIDGDTVLLPDAICRLTAHFSDRRLGAVAGNVVVGNAINVMTRFQALEYVTSQNLDRRAFELFNAIGVVPGAIGAWRREAILQVGGYAPDTMAEDADLTFCVQLHGWRVLTETSAVALTEAPETLRAFMKQRFRWMFGTLQVACKHIRAAVRRPTGISLVTIPNVFVFQMGFTLLAPIMDCFLLWTVVGGFYFDLAQQAETFSIIAMYWVLFQTMDGLAAAIGIALSRERRNWRLLPLILLQRFTYRQLLYVTAIRSLLTAIKGTLIGWGKLVRTGNVFGVGRAHAST